MRFTRKSFWSWLSFRSSRQSSPPGHKPVRLELTPLEERAVPASLQIVSEPTYEVSSSDGGLVNKGGIYDYWIYTPVLSGYYIHGDAGSRTTGTHTFSVHGPLVLKVQASSSSEKNGDLVQLQINWSTDTGMLNYVYDPPNDVVLRETPAHATAVNIQATGAGIDSLIQRTRPYNVGDPYSYQQPNGYVYVTLAIGSTIQIDHTMSGLATTDATGFSLGWANIDYDFYLSAPTANTDYSATSLTRSATKNGVDLAYTLTGAPETGLKKQAKVAFYWATGTTFESRLPGPAAFTANLKKTNGSYTLFAPGFKSAPKGATHLVAVLDSGKVVDETNEYNNVVALEYKPDLVIKTARWTPAKGGVGITYDVTGRSLTKDETTTIAVYWGKNDTPIGAPIYTTEIVGKLGTGKKIQIPGDQLAGAPDEATQLVFVLDPDHTISESNEDNNSKSLDDVTVTFKSDARPVLTTKTIGIIKDALRYAGQASGQVNSTFRTPREQAQAMYNNIISGTSPSYAAAGTKVIKAYNDARKAYLAAKKKDPATPLPDYVGIMEAKIFEIGFNADGTSPVSKHCYDPDDMDNYMLYQALDISFSLMTNKQRFHKAITSDARIAKVLDPFNSKDPAFHIEVPQ